MAKHPPVADSRASSPAAWSRRRWLLGLTGLGGLGMMPEVRVLAAQANDFFDGPPVPDVPAERLSEHVHLVYAKDGFPTAENQGLMASVVFVVTAQGVVVLDSGASLQIGQMAIRQIKRTTSKPVVAVFNSHYHGDHWLGNDAFVREYGPELPIYALPHTIAQIKGVEGNLWRSMMERWTHQATMGTQVVAPNHAVQHGQTFDYGDVTLRLHHHGTAHTPSDLSVQVVQDRVTHVGDIAMNNRIANMDDGSYAGTLAYYNKLQADTGDQLWVAGHGRPSRTLLADYGTFMRGIFEPCLRAVEQGQSEAQAKAAVLADPRVAPHAKTMAGFESNIGKYISLAYLEAEKIAF